MSMVISWLVNLIGWTLSDQERVSAEASSALGESFGATHTTVVVSALSHLDQMVTVEVHVEVRCVDHDESLQSEHSHLVVQVWQLSDHSAVNSKCFGQHEVVALVVDVHRLDVGASIGSLLMIGDHSESGSQSSQERSIASAGQKSKAPTASALQHDVRRGLRNGQERAGERSVVRITETGAQLFGLALEVGEELVELVGGFFHSFDVECDHFVIGHTISAQNVSVEQLSALEHKSLSVDWHSGAFGNYSLDLVDLVGGRHDQQFEWLNASSSWPNADHNRFNNQCSQHRLILDVVVVQSGLVVAEQHLTEEQDKLFAWQVGGLGDGVFDVVDTVVVLGLHLECEPVGKLDNDRDELSGRDNNSNDCVWPGVVLFQNGGWLERLFADEQSLLFDWDASLAGDLSVQLSDWHGGLDVEWHSFAAWQLNEHPNGLDLSHDESNN